jgi:hypothetical protein
MLLASAASARDCANYFPCDDVAKIQKSGCAF